MLHYIKIISKVVKSYDSNPLSNAWLQFNSRAESIKCWSFIKILIINLAKDDIRIIFVAIVLLRTINLKPLLMKALDPHLFFFMIATAREYIIDK